MSLSNALSLTPNEKTTLRLDEAAKILGVDVRTVRNLIKNKALRSVGAGTKRRIEWSELQRFISARATPARDSNGTLSPPMELSDRFLHTDDAADIVGRSRHTLDRWIQEERIPWLNVGA